MLDVMSPRVDSLSPLAVRVDVAEAVDGVRAACLDLRRHPALRRQGEAAAAEAGVRAARANAALAGASLPLEVVRDAVRGAAPYPADAVGQTVRGAVRAQVESRRLGSVWQQAPLQALVRLHVAACAGQLPENLIGRPRAPGEQPQDGHDLFGDDGEAIEVVDGAVLPKRLKSLGKLLTNPGTVPALVVAATVHAELALLRPFVAGNGLVARSLCRAVLIGRGVDTTGVAVWEQALIDLGVRYRLDLARAGQADGAAAWVCTFAQSVIDGAAHGVAVCDAVQAGRPVP